jgi:hypothetical protein
VADFLIRDPIRQLVMYFLWVKNFIPNESTKLFCSFLYVGTLHIEGSRSSRLVVDDRLWQPDRRNRGRIQVQIN